MLLLLLLFTRLPAKQTVPLSPRHRTPAWSERWNVTTPGTWFSGVCLFGADGGAGGTPGSSSNTTTVTFGYSAGDWYKPPYPSRFGTAPLSAPLQATVTPLLSQPGSAWPCRGARDRVAYTGENFGTLAPVLAVFGADGHAVWQAHPPGAVRESWARGALGATSANGELAVFGITFTDTTAATEWAQVLVWNMSTPSAAALLNDSFADGTGIEAILQSESGELVVAVAAVAGTQRASEVRVYDVVAGTISAFTVGWVAASCLSADGRRLVLATANSYNSLLVYKLGRRSQYERLVNTTYPELPGRPTYASSCATSNNGALWVTFPLFWGVSTLNQSAVAFWRAMPSGLSVATERGNPIPTSLWLSNPVDPTLEDSPSSSVYLEGHGLFGLTTWGGALDQATGRTPPTLHLFSELDPATPLLQIVTPGMGGNCSGSLLQLDMAFDVASDTLHVLAAGLNYHENVGSSAGVLYLWDIIMGLVM